MARNVQWAAFCDRKGTTISHPPMPVRILLHPYLHHGMLLVSVQVSRTPCVLLDCSCSQMPRFTGKPVGRTGKKHKRDATHNIHRQPKQDQVEGPQKRRVTFAADVKFEVAGEDSTIRKGEGAVVPIDDAPKSAPLLEIEAAPSPSPLPQLQSASKPHASQLDSRQAALQRARHEMLWDNNWCDCAELGALAPDHPDFIEHHMLCQMHKCYAYEIGCCDGRMEFDLPCDCISPAFATARSRPSLAPAVQKRHANDSRSTTSSIGQTHCVATTAANTGAEVSSHVVRPTARVVLIVQEGMYRYALSARTVY